MFICENSLLGQVPLQCLDPGGVASTFLRCYDKESARRLMLIDLGPVLRAARSTNYDQRKFGYVWRQTKRCSEIASFGRDHKGRALVFGEKGAPEMTCPGNR